MRKTSPFWLTICILTVAAAIVLCCIGASGKILFARPSGDPQKTVTDFLNAVKSGEYATAYSFLDGYSTFGLENSPESEEGRMMFDALRKSYDYSLSGTCVRKGTAALQKVVLARLDLAAVNIAAASMAQAGSEYNIALRQVLDNPQQYITGENVDIALKYSAGKWKIVPDSALIKALQGGIS